jgi:hypothetical protein
MYYYAVSGIRVCVHSLPISRHAARLNRDEPGDKVDTAKGWLSQVEDGRAIYDGDAHKGFQNAGSLLAHNPDTISPPNLG